MKVRITHKDTRAVLLVLGLLPALAGADSQSVLSGDDIGLYPMGIAWLDYAPNADTWRNSTAPDFAGIRMGETRFDVLVGKPYTQALSKDQAIGLASVKSTTYRGLDNSLGNQSAPSASRHTTGRGLRLGWMGRLGSKLTAGLSVQSRIYSNDNDYDGAENLANSTLPPQVSAGLSFLVSPKITLAFDWQRFYYSDLGSSRGKNDGHNQLNRNAGNAAIWTGEDVEVFGVGLHWRYHPNLTLRAGINHTELVNNAASGLTHTDEPRTLANLGLSYRPNPDNIFTLSYSRGLGDDYSAQHPNLIGPQTGPNLGGNEIEVRWGVSFY